MADSVVPKMNWDDPDLPNAIQIFKQQCELYFSVKGTNQQKQVDHILLFTGPTGIRMYNSWSLPEEDKKNPAVVWAKFLEQIKPKDNFRVARLYLQKFKQQPNESIDDFVSRIKLQAFRCSFSDAELSERVIEQIIAGTRHADLQKQLLAKDNTLTLAQAIDLARAFEASLEHMSQLARVQNDPTRVDVHAFRATERNAIKQCSNCGNRHRMPKSQFCPAFGVKCHGCGTKNHFKKVCRKSQSAATPDAPVNERRSRPRSRSRGRRGRSQQRNRPRTQDNSSAVDAIQMQTQDNTADIDNQFHDLNIDTVTVSSIDQETNLNLPDEIYTNVKVQHDSHHAPVSLNVKLDTGARGNTLPLRMYRRMFPKCTTASGYPHDSAVRNKSDILRAYNGTAIKHYGAIVVTCKHDNANSIKTKFYVVESPGPAIIGLRTLLALNLVSLQCEINMSPTQDMHSDTVCWQSVSQLQTKYPEQFDRIGNFPGTYHIVTRPDAHPVIHAPRKCSIHIKEELQAELENMEALGVISKVTEPTDWVNSIALSRRANGKLRVCLDPKDLNKAIMRNHHKVPTLEELTHKFSGAKYFSKFDAKNGYWSVKLDEESSLLTTFNSPFGRYCYKRMPFGLVMSQDVFQHKMDQILESCPGTLGIADDIAVFGRTEQEHDKNVTTLMEVAAQYGLTFNSEKCAVKTKHIKFFGMIYDKNGAHPDPQKVEDIKKLDPPTNKAELQQFLGMVTYLSPFLPHLSQQTSNLRALLKKDVEFVFTPSHILDFQRIKDLICQEATLMYFNPNKPTVVQVDASTKGIGAALLQDNKPIAFASKSLSETEQRYANIERELLAVVFGCERFHTYVFGKNFTIESDHKPLEMILQKPLTAAPPRLQRMLLRLQPYDVTVMYRPGKEILLADALSRLPGEDNHHIDLDVQINFVQFSSEKLTQIQQETASDHTLHALREIIINGWPSRMKELAKPLQPYWSYRDELSVEDGMILKGDRVVIPYSMQEYVLSKLHEGHQGIEKCKLRAKDCVFWVDINKDIEHKVRLCHTCQEHQRTQPKETLMSHEIPTRPWHTVGTDLFFFEGNNYLMVADYYSKFPFVKKMPNHCTSQAVINATKLIFSEQGIPAKVVSDNGRHFDSAQYREFSQTWGFDHVTSSPHFPQSNGFVERMIQTVKNSFKKAKSPEMALLCIRTTPVDSTIPSPAELLYGRKIQGNLPVKIHNKAPHKDVTYSKMIQRQSRQNLYFNQHAHDLPPLIPGQPVRIQDQNSGNWTPAKVTQKCSEPRSYVVKTPSGSILRRNRKHIREVEPSSAKKQVSFDPDTKPPNIQYYEYTNHQEKNLTHEKQPKVHCDKTQNAYATRSGRIVKKPDKLNW